VSNNSELRRELKRIEIMHPIFQDIQTYLKSAVDDALEGFEPRMEWVIGPSRIGKSKLIDGLKRDYPETKINGLRRVPVLTVEILQGVSPKMLPSLILDALGVSLPAKGLTTGVLFRRMLDQLRLAQTKVLLIDEASMLVDVGAKVPPRAAGDWFKTVMDQLNITIVLFGVPRLRKLFDSNEQLKGRAFSACQLYPYNFELDEELLAFASCIRTCADIFKAYGFSIEMRLESLVKNCYLLGGGSVGMAFRVMKELARALHHANESPRSVGLADFQNAMKTLKIATHRECNPFAREEVAPVEMALAHAFAYEDNAMPMPYVKKADQTESTQ
jgi:hypothetical protein